MPPLLDNFNEISLTPIQKFYSGANIFLTGGTGFLGQLIIEKLLRSCPDIGNIYILIRGKKQKNLITRYDELLDGEVFNKLKDVYPKYKYKVVPIEGDCSLPNLGINDQDHNVLITEVSIVFHCAATVNFDEKLSKAIDINVKGTKAILDLCKQMQILKSVVHISTAYSNCAEDVIEEQFYPMPIKANNLISIRNLLDEKIFEKITPYFLDKLPNTYAYTKAIAENVIDEEGQDLPIAIFRPSIILSTNKEPLQGWINNLYGPVGIVAGAGAGILRVVHCDPDVNANIIPADMCVNAVLAIAWETDHKYREAQGNKDYKISIYNYESSKDKPLTWNDYRNLTRKYGLSLPLVTAMWYYSLQLVKDLRQYQLLVLFLHYIPALLVDAVLFIFGKRRRFISLYNKVYRFNEVITYFALRTFIFKSINITNLISSMSPKDKDIFIFDLRKLNWDEYFKSFYLGVRVYLLKDPLSTMSQARKRYARFYFAHQLLKILFWFIIVRIIWMFVSYVILL